MTLELARALLLSGAVTSEKLGEVLHAVVTQGVPLARALVGMGVIDEARLEEELARSQPQVVKKLTPMPEIMDRLPPGLCHRLGVAPVRVDERSGTLEVAVIDTRDPHPPLEIAYHLGKPARPVRASYRALREALESYSLSARALAAPMGSTQAPPLPNSAIPLLRKSLRPGTTGGAAMSPITRRSFESIHELDEADVRFATRGWDNAPMSEPGWAEEVYWDIEPVFELRRLGPPPTVREPEPATIRLQAAEDEPPFSFSIPAPSRVPVSANAPAPPYPDLGTTLHRLRGAEDRDAVLNEVQLGVRTVGRKVALLIIKKDSLVGWSCSPEFGDQSALEQLTIPIRAPSQLTVVLSENVHLGPLMGTLAAPLLRVLKSPSRDVAMAVVRVGERPAVLIVADELGDTMLATKRIEEIAKAAGEALLRILRAKRE